MKKTLFVLAGIILISFAVSAETTAQELALKQLEQQNYTPSQVDSPEATTPFSGDNTGGPTWDRPFTVGTGASGSCSISGAGPVSSETIPFHVDTTGLYTVFSAWTGYDGYLHIYQIAFDPLDQCVNLVALDDDGPGGLADSEIVDVTLTAGVQYYLIASGYGAGDEGPYSGTFNGVGTATLGMVPVELQSFSIE